MNFWRCFAAVLAFALAPAAHATVVYDNIPSLGPPPAGPPFPSGTIASSDLLPTAFADDISLLTPGPRVFETADIAYGASNFSGNETLTLTLRAMNGAPTPESFGFNVPGTVLFSQTVAIPGGSNLAAFNDPSGSVSLPDLIAVELQFGGLEAGEVYSILLFDPQVVGSSLHDFWMLGFPVAGQPWALYLLGGIPGFDTDRAGGPGNGDPVNFGIRITAVDVSEPATLAAFGFGVAVFGLLRRRRQRGQSQPKVPAVTRA
jgi:hypothetical protein